jgi:hypothetical protein
VKVTLVPEQIAPDGFAAIFTLAATFAFTVIVIVPEVAGLPETQAALFVITQLIVFPVDKMASVYVLVLLRTLMPFFFH